MNKYNIALQEISTLLSTIPFSFHMLHDVTYTFWSENRGQDHAVRLVAVAAEGEKWYGSLSWQRAVDQRGQRWKDMWEQQSSIRIWAGTRLHPDLGAARLGQDLPGPAGILMLDCLFLALVELICGFQYSDRRLRRLHIHTGHLRLNLNPLNLVRWIDSWPFDKTWKPGWIDSTRVNRFNGRAMNLEWIFIITPSHARKSFSKASPHFLCGPGRLWRGRIQCRSTISRNSEDSAEQDSLVESSAF